MPRHTANGDPSPADRLASRWQMFRRESNTLYDTLLWQPQDWPILTLQWQSTAWQPPQHVLDLQQAAAAEQAAAAALGIDHDLDHDLGNDSSPSAAAEAGDMDVDSGAAAAAAGRGSLGSRCSSGSPPGSQHSADDDVIAMPFEYQYILTGEQTIRGETSNLILWRVSLLGHVPTGFNPDRQQLALAGASIEPVMVIPHGHQDVNRLHLMPQNPNLVATCSDDPQVRIYDLSRNTPAQHPTQRSGSRSPRLLSAADHDLDHNLDHDHDLDLDPDHPPEQTAVLGGRSAGGFGLEWNPVHEGLLLGADVQGSVQIWDVGSSSSSSTKGAVIEPVWVERGFSSCPVNDISWHSSGNTFAAATEDGRLLVQDIRAGAAAAVLGIGFGVLRSGRAHVRKHRQGSHSAGDLDCLSVDFDPNHIHRLATGGKDGYVNIWDMRRLTDALERLPLHAGDVRHVSWSRGAPGLLASTGEDSHVLLWDVHKMKNAVKRQQRQRQQARPSAAAAAKPPGLSLPEPRMVNAELSDAIQQLSVPGLLFLHHGHMSAVEQVAWNPDRPWMLASVSGSSWAADRSKQDVEVQQSTMMVWEVNRSVGLLC